MNSSRADLHCHSTASQVSKLGVQRALGLPECATPPEEVYSLAKRRGMDFVTITDHDTIDGVLEIADRPDVFVSEELTAQLPRRAAGRARALLRDHARRSRVAAGARGRRRGRRRLPARERDRLRAGPPVLRGRGAAAAAPPAPARAALRRLGGAQRLARAGAQPPGRDLRRDARRRRRRRLATTTRAWTSAAPGPRRRSRPARTSSSQHLRAGRVERPRRAGLRGQVGARRDGAGRPRARPRRLDRRAGPGRGPAHGRARDDGGRCPQRLHRL